MGIYGENFTWRNHTGHYSYFINWNVSYNWSLAMGGDAWYDCVGSASANLIIKSNLYDVDNQTNVWPNGASGTMRTFTQNCPTIGPPNPATSPGSELNNIIFNPAGHDGLPLIENDTYTIWSEMILKTTVTSSYGFANGDSYGRADIDMQDNSQYGKIVSLIIES
jgi:hypothetical protein